MRGGVLAGAWFGMDHPEGGFTSGGVKINYNPNLQLPKHTARRTVWKTSTAVERPFTPSAGARGIGSWTLGVRRPRREAPHHTDGGFPGSLIGRAGGARWRDDRTRAGIPADRLANRPDAAYAGC